MKLLLISLLLLSSTVEAQKKWYSISTNDVAIMGLQTIAGSADAINQNVTHYKYKLGDPFWNFNTSWKRKYKDWPNNLDAAYPGAKTWLVWTTDGYHLTRTIDRAATLATIGISAADFDNYAKKDRWKVVMKKVVLSAIANRLAFNILYKNERIK